MHQVKNHNQSELLEHRVSILDENFLKIQKKYFWEIFYQATVIVLIFFKLFLWYIICNSIKGFAKKIFYSLYRWSKNV